MPRATRNTSTPTGSKKRDIEETTQSPLRSPKRTKQEEEEDELSTDEEKENKAEEKISPKVTGKKSRQVVKKEDKPATAGTTAKTPRKTKKEASETEMAPIRPRTQGLKMFVGAHVSAAKGVFNAINNSRHIGGNAFALFLKSQRKWDNPPLQDDVRDKFHQLSAEKGYDASKHVLPHGSYLVNLAQEDKAKAKQAYNSFLDDLHRCEALGIKLYNFHPGSANQTPLPSALTRLAKALTEALTSTSTVIPVLETMCGHGSTIGGSLSEFRQILDQIPSEYHPRIGICIDTCHSFAAGYDLTSTTGFQTFMKEFEDVVGIQHLKALHLNDSKAPRGSHRDLHANIGTGFLGLRAFHNVMNEPRFEGIPMILETPIDRPPPSKTPSKPTNPINEPCEDEHSASDSEPESSSKTKKTPKKAPKKPAAKKEALVADPSVWAREIELLESLIGMDAESEEFRKLEVELAEEGREMREKQQEQYERKLAAEEKKKAKGAGKGSGNGKGQKSLMDMMKKKE